MHCEVYYVRIIEHTYLALHVLTRMRENDAVMLEVTRQSRSQVHYVIKSIIQVHHSDKHV